MTKTDAETQRGRADKWLWHARFFRTRGRAADVVSAGKLRVNGARVAKPAHTLRIGDVLTFSQERTVRVVRVTGFAERRGPASEAQQLYQDLTPETEPDLSRPQTARGRVDKKQRRMARESRTRPLE